MQGVALAAKYRGAYFALREAESSLAGLLRGIQTSARLAECLRQARN
jgi:hypothetical protein